MAPGNFKRDTIRFAGWGDAFLWLDQKERERRPHLDKRWVFVIKLEISVNEMIVSRRNVDSFVVGDAFARNCRQQVSGKCEKQAGDQDLSLVRKECPSDRFPRAC